MAIDLTSNCVGFWKLDDNLPTAEVINEVGANGEIMFSTTAAASVEGKVGRAFGLAGLPGRYVDCTDLEECDFGEGQDFAIAAWFKVGTVGQTAVHLINKRENFSPNQGYMITYEGRTAQPTFGTITFSCDLGTPWAIVTSETLVNDGEWHFIIAQRSGTTYQLFLDNVQEGGDITADSLSVANSNPLRIGATQSLSGGFWPGLVDNVMLFNAALNATQRAFLWNNGQGRGVLTQENPSMGRFGDRFGNRFGGRF